MPFKKGESGNPATQWKPGGKSPNPSGKPPGTRHLSTYIKEMMEDEEFETVLRYDKKSEVHFKGAPIRAIIAVAMQRAARGDERWAEWLARHGWGSKLIIDSEDPVEAALRALGLMEGNKDAGQNSGSKEKTS